MEAALRTESPSSQEEAAELLRAAGAEGKRVRPVGGATKLAWGRPALEPDLELSTRGLARIVEHNAGDLTTVLEPGVPFARAQEAFAEEGQMVSLDPPLGPGGSATFGGVVASADSGPLRHRYGAARDLLVGMKVALSDGTVARAGGKVIKNVAGYDLTKLFTGSFGTLGLILEVTARLHPRPEGTATATLGSDDPDALRSAAAALGHSPLDMLSLDVRWEHGRGAVMARFGGAASESQGHAALRLVEARGLEGELETDDADLWEAQRSAQRAAAADEVTVRVAGTQGQLPLVLGAAERVDASVAGRAGLGLWWLRLTARDDEDHVRTIDGLRRELAPAPCVVLDAPATVRAALDPWHEAEGPRLDLMRRVKQRFDPLGACSPGVFVGGI